MTHTKTVLITGAGSGIGRALAKEAASNGFTLILAGRTLATLEQTRSDCGGADMRCIAADVTTPEGRAAIAEVVGPALDILINNAGVLSVGHIGDMSDTDLERMTTTNLLAPMALTRDLLPALRRSHGRIVNIGSVFGDIGYPFFAGYSATKFGLRGFSDALRRELSGAGIGVTYVAPRATRTAAESSFAALVEPMDMTLDSAETVATQAWNAILKGKRECFPKGPERFFVKIQRLFPSLVDKSVGAQARDPKTLAALKPLPSS
ncbi:SDR family NAD(P)-dependent oxidoreductase [Roseovarius faecimaris]|uniref:SDR family NAD(P)-dependent oxidoreductase n=1 Tax=Roseovarius faecimaris TaxID=2494550 RepID=A0A6I6J2T5_9RHOB|nr:SDR family NAD(P)-dependent oxidoreductase [Roseovarius faecimaris]QGX99088.1 SDR family NAD(P)-dependent oxidoreductase [Roseovarius faecimaris]